MVTRLRLKMVFLLLLVWISEASPVFRVSLMLVFIFIHFLNFQADPLVNKGNVSKPPAFFIRSLRTSLDTDRGLASSPYGKTPCNDGEVWSQPRHKCVRTMFWWRIFLFLVRTIGISYLSWIKYLDMNFAFFINHYVTTSNI